jgi:protocatechuate 3,4-dioxygenase beta subunit
MICLPQAAALADLSTIPPGSAEKVGGATYITADPDLSAPATLWLAAVSARIGINGGEPARLILSDGRTLPINGAPLSGASFAVVALSASGEERPWPDPSDPARPWVIDIDSLPEPLLLPTEPPLYLRQLSAPDGYSIITELIPLTGAVPFGETLDIVNQPAGGLLQVSSHGSASFTLADPDGTDAASSAVEPGLPWIGLLPDGEYLFSPSVPDGYAPVDPSVITILDGGMSSVDISCEPMPRLEIRIRSAAFTLSGEKTLTPVSGESVTLTSPDGSVIRMLTDADGLARRTDQDASDTPTALPGAYTLRAGREPERAILLESGQDFIWDIYTHDGAGQIRLDARSYDTRANSAPLSGVSVSIHGEAGAGGGSTLSRTLTTGDAGTVWLSDLPEGAYTLELMNAPQGYSAQVRQVDFEIRGGEETSVTIAFTKDARVYVERVGRVVDGGGAASLSPLPGSYNVYDASGNWIGSTDPVSGIVLTAAANGTDYTFVESEPADGFQPDGVAHTLTLYPGETVTLDAFADSTAGLFSLSHEDPNGGAVNGGAFELTRLDIPGEPLRFTLGNNSYYDAPYPIPSGRYLLTITEAADGYMADPSRAPISQELIIEPYLRGDGSPSGSRARAVFISEPIPEGAMYPAAPALIISETILDLSAEREARVTIMPAEVPLPVHSVEFIIDMNDESGVSLSNITIPYVDGVDWASISIGDGVNWIDETILTPPASARWDDVRANVRRARVTLTSEKVFSLSGLALDATIRALPRMSVDSTLAVSAITRIETRIQTSATQTSVIEGRSSATARVELITAHRQSQGSVFEDPDMDRIRGTNDIGAPFVRVTASDASGNVIDETVTDADGAFAFDKQVPSNAVLTLSFDELHERTPSRYALFAQSGWRFAVLPESALAGIIISPPSLPPDSPDIWIALTRNGEQIAKTAPDETGAFRIGELAPGRYELIISLPPGYLPIDPPGFVELPFGAITNIELAAREAASISGSVTVRGLDPSIAEHASVILSSESGAAVYEAEVGIDGRFTLDTVEPGEYTLRWRLPSSAALEEGAPSSEIVALRSGERLTRSVTIVPGASINGTITDHAGIAIKNASARLTMPDGSTLTSTIDNNGAFSFANLAAGGYALEPILPEGMILYAGERSFTLEAGGETRAEWTAFVPASIEGTVWLDDGGTGAPLSGVSVTALDDQGYELSSTVTNGEGGFTLEGLPPAKTLLRLTAPEGMAITAASESALREPLQLDPGRGVTVGRVGLARVSTIEASVWQDRNDDGLRDSEDQSLDGVTVTLYKDGEPIDARRTNADGIAAFESVRPGGYLLEVSVPERYAPPVGFDQPIWTVSVGYEPQTIPARIPLTPLTDLTGSARRSDGEPAPGLIVRVETTDGKTVAEASSDEGGSFALTRVRPGNYTITYITPGYGWAFEETDERSITRAVTVGDGTRGLTVPPLAQLGGINGTVYADADGDGAQDEDEPGLPNASISILDGGGHGIADIETDRQGAFSVDGLRPGSYTVKVSLPEGYLSAADTQSWIVALGMGGSASIGSVGAYKPASLEGIVVDESGAPLSGAALSLSRSGAPVGASTTGEDGSLAFRGLKPGSYSLSVTLPGGYLFADRTDSEPLEFTLRSGERLALNKVEAVQSSSISGVVWLDAEYDGLPGLNETPVSGVMITLLDESGGAIRQALTQLDGLYSMDLLPPGEYRLHAALPDGLIFTKPELTIEGGSIMPLTSGRQAFSGAFTLLPGQSLSSLGVGAVAPGAIVVETYADANADGQRGLNEPPLSGVTISLTDESGASTASSTGADGRLRFERLRPGAYSLEYRWPEGYVGVNVVDEIILAMGESRDDPRAGAAVPGSVSGIAFEDMDADGLRGADEPALPGVGVSVETSSGIVSTQTGEDGSYFIDGLLPGMVTVRFTLPPGMIFTRQRDGGSIAEALDGNESSAPPLALAMGGSLANVNAGALRSGTVGDYAWIDLNLNGMQDSAEPGLPGVNLTLERASDGLWTRVAETTTDIYGFYEFGDVRPGTYRVSARVPEGYIPTRRAEGVPEINSKLGFRAENPAATDLIIVESNGRARNADLGFARSDDAYAAGWKTVGGGDLTLP